jgi:hypothetical protein
MSINIYVTWISHLFVISSFRIWPLQLLRPNHSIWFTTFPRTFSEIPFGWTSQDEQPDMNFPVEQFLAKLMVLRVEHEAYRARDAAMGEPSTV